MSYKQKCYRNISCATPRIPLLHISRVHWNGPHRSHMYVRGVWHNWYAINSSRYINPFFPLEWVIIQCSSSTAKLCFKVFSTTDLWGDYSIGDRRRRFVSRTFCLSPSPLLFSDSIPSTFWAIFLYVFSPRLPPSQSCCFFQSARRSVYLLGIRFWPKAFLVV